MLSLGERADEAGRFAAGLVERVDRVIDDAVARVAAFRAGRAYCHRCGSSDCEHGLPPSCRHVFAGLAATGTPRWEDFAQLCLERRHPEVERLFDDPPALIVLVDGERALDGALLATFRNPSYELLAQAAAGFFAVGPRGTAGRGVLALTIQVARWTSAEGGSRLGVNLIGRAPESESLEGIWERLGEPPWRRAVRWAQAALQSPRGGSARDRTPDGRQRRAIAVLDGVARRLQHDRRARARRTLHAERRHVSGQRPTGKALEDARAADGSTLLVDDRSGSIVVLGERGRTHFFGTNGLHVSSARYSRDAIDRKLKSGVWRPAPAGAREAFRSRLRADEERGR
jgi:hypothetical protein